MAATIAGLAIAAGIGVYNIVKGAKQKKEAKKLAEQNKRPLYKTPTYEYDNQRLIESMANQGMSPEAKDAAQREYRQGLSSSINAILQGGGNPNDIGKLYNGYSTQVGQLALADDRIRQRNIDRLVSQNMRMTDNSDKDFQYNKYAPYVDTAAKASALYAGGDQQVNSGVNQVGGAVASGIGAYGRMMDTKRVQGIDMGSSSSSAYSNVTPSGNPLSSTYINNQSYNNSIYDPYVGDYTRSLNLNRIKPQNRQAIWSILNERQGSGNNADLLVQP